MWFHGNENEKFKKHLKSKQEWRFCMVSVAFSPVTREK